MPSTRPVASDVDSPVTISGHSLHLEFKQVVGAFKPVGTSGQKFEHQDPSRYIGKILILDLDTADHATGSYLRGSRFSFTFNAGGTTGTLTVGHTDASAPITIEWDNIVFTGAAGSFDNAAGRLGETIQVTDRHGATHTRSIANPGNCQIQLLMKHDVGASRKRGPSHKSKKR
jgi:hypothetical protein